MKVAVAMSGGVDSSVAALVLKEHGYEVIGLTMRLWPCDDAAEPDPRVCCGPAAVRDAQRVAEELGIRHYTVELSRSFEESVVRDFVSEYARGRTPNPCILCNQFVKFGLLLRKAQSLGASRFATGHHAIIERDPAGRYGLLRATDVSKDQSYFLYRMNQHQLERVLMPVGTMTKEEVRARASAAELHVAERPESQDVCFVPRGDVGAFLEARLPNAVRPGRIVDREGNVIGEHRGVARYTVGQRSGLGLCRPRPTYVLRIDAESNTLVVGDESDLYARKLSAADLHWISGAPPASEFRAQAKIRHAALAVWCRVRAGDRVASVTFEEPVRAVSPGQAVVFYDGPVVLGGGKILS